MARLQNMKKYLYLVETNGVKAKGTSSEIQWKHH